MADYSRSVLLSALVVVAAVVGSQLFKESLSATRPGTLIGGCLGSTVFIFTLTAISNIKMSNFGDQAASGLAEVFGSILFGAIVAASIHRVSATICILFSLLSLVFLTGISHQRYSIGSAQQAATIKKRK